MTKIFKKLNIVAIIVASAALNPKASSGACSLSTSPDAGTIFAAAHAPSGCTVFQWGFSTSSGYSETVVPAPAAHEPSCNRSGRSDCYIQYYCKDAPASGGTAMADSCVLQNIVDGAVSGGDIRKPVICTNPSSEHPYPDTGEDPCVGPADAPAVTTLPATGIALHAATLHGDYAHQPGKDMYILNNGIDGFRFATESYYNAHGANKDAYPSTGDPANTDGAAVVTNGAKTLSLTSLTCGLGVFTTIHYRYFVITRDQGAGIYFGDDKTFSAYPCPAPPPPAAPPGGSKTTVKTSLGITTVPSVKLK